MLVYNSQNHRKEELKQIEEGKIRMYVYGPTVYDQIHIGNARTFLSFDVIRRYLTYKGYQVTFAQNLTDVDDKIINRANDEGRTAAEVAEEYSAAFIEQMHRFGILDPDIRPRATREIEAMQEMIQLLIEKDHAYVADNGDVYFSVRSDHNYGILSGRELDQLRAGERVEVNEDKRDPFDFALWKAAKPGEPSWPSPWGDGRPGWHTECCAMIHRYLGTPIDIHGGGWTYGDKDVYQHYCMDMAQRGFTVVNFSYRLSPEDPYPAALEDINAAFTWVAENAAAYNIDLDKICVTGDSAGAQLASQYLALLTNSAFRRLFSMQIPYEQIKVKAVALNCGCYDMRGRVEAQEDDPFLAYIDRALTENRELTLEQIDTVKYINADFPPAYIMSAEYDFLKEHVKPMYELLRAKGIVCEWKLYGKAEDTYMGHVFHLNQRLEEAKICNDDECRFFDEILGA